MGIEAPIAPELTLILVLIVGSVISALVGFGVAAVLLTDHLNSRKAANDGRTSNGLGLHGGRRGDASRPRLVHSDREVARVTKKPAG